MSIQTAVFGQTSDGDPVTLFVCTNASGMRMKLIDYGAHLVSFETPDRDSNSANIILGFPSLQGYLGPHPSFGSTIGRFCNRIARGRFELGGREYALATNNGPNHLHGGVRGFNRHLWSSEPVSGPDRVGVRFWRTSPDGEEGYPGALEVSVSYTLNSQNELSIEYEATTDAATIVNLTNHCYWNLAGAGADLVLDHELMIWADQFLAVDETLIPTGEYSDVTGTPFDFREPHAIGARIDQTGGDPVGYDHCYVLREPAGSLRRAARVKEPKSGRVMEVLTTQPGIQFYSANFLNGSETHGTFPKNAALCLETQHFPDSPNHPEFPSTILQPGGKLHEVTVHRFSIEP